MSSRHNRDALPMTSQQYGCLNKTYVMSLHAYVGRGNSTRPCPRWVVYGQPMVLQGKSVFFRDYLRSVGQTHTKMDSIPRWYLSACVYVYGYMCNSIIIEQVLNLRGTERNIGKVGMQRGKDGNYVNIASHV